MVDWDFTGGQVARVVEDLSRHSPQKITLLPGYDLSTMEAVHWGGSIRTLGKPGLATFGPHAPLRAGRYAVEITGIFVEASRGEILCSIATNFGRNAVRDHVTKIDADAAEGLSIKFTFSIPDDVDCYEIKIRSEGTVFVSLDQICIDRFTLETEVIISQ